MALAVKTTTFDRLLPFRHQTHGGPKSCQGTAPPKVINHGMQSKSGFAFSPRT
jgi:hypothetical protein